MRRKYIYKKLIRDKIPQIMELAGDDFKVRILDSSEFEMELKKKLVEEAKEVAKASQDELAKELADVLQLLKSLTEHYKIDFSAVEKMQKERKAKRGSFSKRLYLEWATGKPGK